MYNLRNKFMHYADDLPEGADLKEEAVAVIEQIAQYMTKEALLHHSRPLALAYLALTEEVDSVPVVRCKDCYQSVVIGDVLHCTYWGKDTDENGYCHEGG